MARFSNEERLDRTGRPDSKERLLDEGAYWANQLRELKDSNLDESKTGDLFESRIDDLADRYAEMWPKRDQDRKKASFRRRIENMVDKGNFSPEYGTYEVPEEAKYSERLAQLRGDVEKYFKTKGAAIDVVKSMLDAQPTPLYPEDLLGGDRQEEAIRMVVGGSNPEMAELLIAKVSAKPGSAAHKEAIKELENIKEIISDAHDAASAHKEALSKHATDTVTGSITDGLRGIAKKAAQNPGQALALVGGSILALTLLYRLGPDSVKKGMRWTGAGVAGAAGLGVVALGADWVTRAYREDNKGLFDFIKWHPDTFNEEESLSRYRSLFADLMPGDSAAAADLIRLGNAKSSTVADLFEESMRNGTGKLSSSALFSRGALGRGRDAQRKLSQMDEASTYAAIEYVMLQCANQVEGTTGKTKSDRLIAGLDYFKKNFASGRDWELMYALQELANPTGIPEKDRYAYASSFGVPTFRSVELSEHEQAAELTKIFTETHGDKVVIEALGKDRGISELRVNGLLVEYTFNEEAREHVFRDPWGSEDPWKIPADMGGPEPQAMIDVIGERMTDRIFKDLNADKLLIEVLGVTNATEAKERITFDAEHGYWVIEPPLTTSAHPGFGDFAEKVPLKMVVHERWRNEISIFVEGMSDDAFEGGRMTDLAQALDAFEKKTTYKERLSEDLVSAIGDMRFEIDDFADTPATSSVLGRTEVKIKYGEGLKKEAIAIYENGSLLGIEGLDNEDPKLMAAREAFANERAHSFARTYMGIEGGEYQNLWSVFEGYWKSGKWENVEIIATRSWETLFGGSYSKDKLGRGLLHHREEWWDGTLRFKMEEYQADLERQIVELMMSEDPSTSKPWTPRQLEAKMASLEEIMMSEINSNFRALHNTVKGDLEKHYEDPDHGANLEEVLAEHMERMDQLSYDNSAYRDFATRLEEIMNKPGFDWKGADNWNAGRARRQAVRVAAYKMAWPIPVSASVGPDEVTYLGELLVKIEETLQAMQKDHSGNMDWLVTEDRRIPVVDFYEEFKARKSPWKTTGTVTEHTSTTISTGPAPALSGVGGGGLKIELDYDEEREFIADECFPEIEDRFEKFDTVDRNPFRKSLLETMIEVNIRRSKVSFDAKVQRIPRSGGTVERDKIEAVLEDHLARIDRRLRRYDVHISNGNYAYCIEGLTSDTITHSDWKATARALIENLGADQEATATALQTVLPVYIDMLDKAPGYGAAVPGNTAENYMRYFLYETNKILVGTGGATGSDLAGQIKTAFANNPQALGMRFESQLRGLKPYSEWANSTGEGSPLDPYDNADMDFRGLAEAYKEKKIEQMDDDFDSWYKSKKFEAFGMLSYVPKTKTEAWTKLLDDMKDYRLSTITTKDVNEREQQVEMLKKIIDAELVAVYKPLLTAETDPGVTLSTVKSTIEATFKNSANGFGGVNIPRADASRSAAQLSRYQAKLKTETDSIIAANPVSDTSINNPAGFAKKMSDFVAWNNFFEKPLLSIDELKAWEPVFEADINAKFSVINAYQTANPSAALTGTQSRFTQYINVNKALVLARASDGVGPSDPLGQAAMAAIDATFETSFMANESAADYQKKLSKTFVKEADKIGVMGLDASEIEAILKGIIPGI